MWCLLLETVATTMHQVQSSSWYPGIIWDWMWRCSSRSSFQYSLLRLCFCYSQGCRKALSLPLAEINAAWRHFWDKLTTCTFPSLGKVWLVSLTAVPALTNSHFQYSISVLSIIQQEAICSGFQWILYTPPLCTGKIWGPPDKFWNPISQHEFSSAEK